LKNSNLQFANFPSLKRNPTRMPYNCLIIQTSSPTNSFMLKEFSPLEKTLSSGFRSHIIV
jgi:hypothetical protein